MVDLRFANRQGMVEILPSEISERKALQRKLVENERKIANIVAQIERNNAQMEENTRKIKINERQTLYLLTLKMPLAITIGVTAMLVFVIFHFPYIFADVATDYGFDAYAEKPIWFAFQPDWLKMPANTLVNLGYIFVGFYWIKELRRAFLQTIDSNKFVEENGYRDYDFSLVGLKAGFCWSSVVYGFIQGARLFWQSHSLSVLDQWVTLPIFALCGLLCNAANNGPSNFIVIAISLALSLLSYLLTLLSPIGFEIALGLHIIIVVSLAVNLCCSLNDKTCWKYFSFGVLFCIGFVLLKLLDFKLTSVSSSFHYFSGHFWSKICDILQIHYSVVFIEACQFYVKMKEL